MVIGKGLENGFLTPGEIRKYTDQALSQAETINKRILVIIPDLTRNAPIPLMFKILFALLNKKAKNLDYFIASGTHPVLNNQEIAQRIGVTASELNKKYSKIQFFNHFHDKPKEISIIDTVSAGEIAAISNGLLKESVNIKLNKILLKYNLLIILSPVAPHSNTGFSGGYKYLIPGCAGDETVALFHWLGAIITNLAIIGKKNNPVRTFLERACALVKVPILCFNFVMSKDEVRGLFIGDIKDSWLKAADLSAKLHVRYVDKPYRKILGIAHANYRDIWLAGKVMYTLEPIATDGGELIIYAPHIKKISETFDEIINKVGYHVPDYFLKQMDKFQDIPRVVLGHSTNLKGAGTYENGVEKARIKVTLATAIPENTCKQVNLDYRNPAAVNFEQWQDRENEGILFVENAGEILYKLRNN